jgi:hypothetical protein
MVVLLQKENRFFDSGVIVFLGIGDTQFGIRDSEFGVRENLSLLPDP